MRGCTALLDAVGSAIHHIGNVHEYAREEDRPQKTVFIITTDGMENASCCYSYKEIKHMVERQKEKYGWEFIFIGANIDAAGEACKMGIERDRAATYACDAAETAINFEAVNEVVKCLRCSEPIGDNWSEKIEKYRARKEK